MSRYDRKDHYHRRAKREGFRSRAAYKLAEIQRSRRLLRPGQRVVDLGCWPGGWMQVASRAVGAGGRVVGVDRVPVELLEEDENTIALCLDLAGPSAAPEILRALGGPADVLLSDAAPKLTGVRPTDRAREEALLEAIERLIPELLRPGGDLLVKILEGPEARAVEERIRARFERSRTLRPAASRRGTTERYLLARGHRGDAGVSGAGYPAAGASRAGEAPVPDRPFSILGIQQIAVGALEKSALRRLWVEMLGLTPSGRVRSESENVDEDIVVAGSGPLRVEVDLMQPIDPEGRPRVHLPPLNHVGLWVDDLRAAVDWLAARGVRFAAGGIRRGASGHDVCFIHPKGSDAAPIGGAGVLIELVQAPPAVIEAFRRAASL